MAYSRGFAARTFSLIGCRSRYRCELENFSFGPITAKLFFPFDDAGTERPRPGDNDDVRLIGTRSKTLNLDWVQIEKNYKPSVNFRSLTV